MSTRTHFFWPITDENGDLRLYVQVKLYEIDGVTPYAGKIYRDRLSSQEWGNPFVAAPALIDLYLEDAAQVRLGLTPDPSRPEILTEIIDVSFDADLSVTSEHAQRVEGPPQVGALLCGIDVDSAFWKPLRIDHEHAMIAAETVLAGRTSNLLKQVGGYAGTTVIGADAGGYRAATTLNDSTMLGVRASGSGRGTVAAGHDSLAVEGAQSPWRDGAVALGGSTMAGDEGVAIGAGAQAVHAVSLGRLAGGGDVSVVIGSGARASIGGIALGRAAGVQSAGPTDSIGLGARTSYGLPSDPVNWAVMLGAFDPTAPRLFSDANSATKPGFPWDNPLDSQSESPFRETSRTMQFSGKTVQIQRHLTWLADIAGLQTLGDATLGGRAGKVGFYGATPLVQQTVGEDEPGTGIPALDNLILALRQLALLRTRREALVTYRAEDMVTTYRHGDLVPRWSEHAGTDTAVNSPVGRALPSFYDPDPQYNGRPTVVFRNGVDRESVKPIQELRGQASVDQMRHVIVVAEHEYHEFGLYEGMVNLTGLEQVLGQNTIYMSNSKGSKSWQLVNASKYAMDGLSQTSNGSAGLDDTHVYRMTSDDLWPSGRLIIGGPRDQEEAGNDARNWDNFTGSIAEIVGLDETWDEEDVSSMERGLMFLYGIRQDSDDLLEPAQDFLLKSHDPVDPARVDWSDDYESWYRGRVYGNVYRISTPIVQTPYIMLWDSSNMFTTREPIAGYWGHLPGPPSAYEVLVSVFDWDGDHDRYDYDVNTDVPALEFDDEHEEVVGVFPLNNNGTWSTGRQWTKYGHKVARIREKATGEFICRQGEFTSRHADTDVRVYSRRDDGTLRLEGSSPLWGFDPDVGDVHGFAVRVTHTGKKVLRVYETSTDTILASTERQDTALPRTQVYASDDPEVSAEARDTADPYASALAVMALLEMSWRERFRARTILETLGEIVNDDGSLNTAYSASEPVKEDGTPDVWGMSWVILAVLRYTEATGDDQFIGLAEAVAGFLAGEALGLTRDVVAAYFALRDLGAYTGTTSYTTAAQACATALLSNYWDAAENRWREGINSDRESLWATVLGGMFSLATGDRVRARASLQHLRRFRVRGAAISAPHYNGPSGLTGYKPLADLGDDPYVNPPAIIDQAGTWAAILFKARYGEPVGDDIQSMLRWDGNSIYNDPADLLFGEQFLSYNTNATTGGYAFRARPNVGTAGWARLLGNGGRWLLTADPLPVPTVVGLTTTATRAPGSNRITFTYAWTRTGGPAAAYEAFPEWSTNGGSTWNTFSSHPIADSVEDVRTSAGSDSLRSTWSAPVSGNSAMRYRTRVRMRNAAFGPWVASSSVVGP